ncbi:MAG TPA: hypothetical protein VKQ72_18865 [Aggregatilineales bacterium]|nr:hypothetical protein [Aggregatilineales bacterium]
MKNTGNRAFQFRLAAGEVCRLPRSIREIRIVAGQAWVTYGGKDVILNAGDSTQLGRKEDQSLAVISALKHAPLVFDAAA